MNKKMRIHFSTGVKYNGMYYLTAIHMNALFMYDEKKDKLSLLTSFQKEKKNECLYLKAFLYKNEAWFIPHQADNIAIVNLDTYSINYMPLDYQKCYNDEGVKYVNTLYFNEKFLCLIPWAVDTVMIIDLQNKDVVAYYAIVEQNRNYQSAIFLNNKICFFPWKTKDILVLDLKTDERVLLPRKEEEESFGDVVYDKKTGYVYHAPAKENCILIDTLDGEIYKKIKLDSWEDKEYKTFYSTEGIKDIFFWGHEKNIVIKVNKNDNNIKIYSITPRYSQKYFYPIYSDDIEALVYDGSCIIKYNMDKDEFFYLNLCLNYDELVQEMKDKGIDVMRIKRDKLISENDEWNLTYFLSCLLDSLRIKDSAIKENKGNQIYSNITEFYC